MNGQQATRSPLSSIDETFSLRKKAESLWRERAASLAESANTMSLQGASHLPDELQVHQIELELQNEALQSSCHDLALSMERYFALYDQAPVGYCTLSEQGVILGANLTAATLLGARLERLVSQSFSHFVLRADQDVFYMMSQQLASSGLPQSIELRMVKTQGTPFWAHLVSTVQHAPGAATQHLVAISDISELRRISLAERKAELALSLLQSQEQSRRRFSCELHDRTSANLAALRLNLELILKTAAPSRDTPAFTDCVADTWALLEDTNTGIRDICQDLHPPAFYLGGLTAAVQSYAHSIHKRTGLAVQVACHHPKIDLPSDLELALFRIVQEALTNCTKHARASVVTVNLQLDTQPLQISVADDGIGFDPQALTEVGAPGARQSSGQGLRHMRQSAEFFNAIFRIDSAPGCGTRICLEIPCPCEVPRS